MWFENVQQVKGMSPTDTSGPNTGSPPCHDHAERLRDESPSAKLVYRVLHETNRPLTTREVSERTLLSSRTTRYALGRLREAGIVTRNVCPDDPRQYQYHTVDG